jgi:hypothetical protein
VGKFIILIGILLWCNPVFALTGLEVRVMAESGVPEDFILQQISISRTAFTELDLRELRQAGVSPHLLLAMAHRNQELGRVTTESPASPLLPTPEPSYSVAGDTFNVPFSSESNIVVTSQLTPQHNVLSACSEDSRRSLDSLVFPVDNTTYTPSEPEVRTARQREIQCLSYVCSMQRPGTPLSQWLSLSRNFEARCVSNEQISGRILGPWSLTEYDSGTGSGVMTRVWLPGTEKYTHHEIHKKVILSAGSQDLIRPYSSNRFFLARLGLHWIHPKGSQLEADVTGFGEALRDSDPDSVAIPLESLQHRPSIFPTRR